MSLKARSNESLHLCLMILFQSGGEASNRGSPRNEAFSKISFNFPCMGAFHSRAGAALIEWVAGPYRFYLSLPMFHGLVRQRIHLIKLLSLSRIQGQDRREGRSQRRPLSRARRSVRLIHFGLSTWMVLSSQLSSGVHGRVRLSDFLHLLSFRPGKSQSHVNN